MPHETTDPAGAKDKLSADDCLLIDVRTPEEFAAGHVPGAYNVPFIFRTAQGAIPNADFVSVLEANFAKDASLVFQ
ncbi:MAG: rhodanese-related sulfurtransferase [Planctomycetota bacterium]|jgi:rhodanese-related sulfurtransferase